MRPSCTSSSLSAALALALLAVGCGSDLDRLPGTYVGSLDSANQHSRMANLRPDDAGAYQADITHYSGGDSRQGAQVTIRKVGDSAGNPVFEADLAGLCTLRFEGHDGGHLGDGLQRPTCVCMADGRPIEGARLAPHAGGGVRRLCGGTSGRGQDSVMADGAGMEPSCGGSMPAGRGPD
ncbi:MAG: hypothetical protein R3A79_01505 [Nannocystaceae bacterium]